MSIADLSRTDLSIIAREADRVAESLRRLVELMPQRRGQFRPLMIRVEGLGHIAHRRLRAMRGLKPLPHEKLRTPCPVCKELVSVILRNGEQVVGPHPGKYPIKNAVCEGCGRPADTLLTVQADAVDDPFDDDDDDDDDDFDDDESPSPSARG